MSRSSGDSPSTLATPPRGKESKGRNAGTAGGRRHGPEASKKFDLRATGWDESSSRGRAGVATLRNSEMQNFRLCVAEAAMITKLQEQARIAADRKLQRTTLAGAVLIQHNMSIRGVLFQHMNTLPYKDCDR